MAHSIVKTVQANGTWESPKGILYKFLYEFEDGKTVSANHKTITGLFAVGKKVEYEIKGSNDYGNWGSVKKPEVINAAGLASDKDIHGPGLKQNRDATQQYIVRQSCLKLALDHLMFRENGGDEKAVTKENIMAMAEIYTDYVFEGL